MKYVYLWYVKMTQEALKKNIADNKYSENWTAKARELCKKHGMKLLLLGSPYATVEQIVVGVETDVPLDEFGKLTTDLYHIDPAFIEYAKTMIITQ
ncbi:MAG: hypothetical protein V1710_06945 [Candidatus Bathyarchaeota archaeon]